jgi:hypothetical protein
MVDRTALRRAYRPAEEDVVGERLEEAAFSPAEASESAAIARSLSKAVRAHKPAGIDAFMAAYDLGSDEGIALMCLAEALLRIPDAETADDLIADKLAGPNWAEKLGESSSPFVNAATFSLLLTGKVLDNAKDSTAGWSRRSTLSRLWLPTMTCSPTDGAASVSPSRLIRSAPCPCATGSPSSPASISADSWSGWSRAPIGTPRSRRRRSPG